MPTSIPLSSAEQFALMRGVCFNTNPKHSIFRGLTRDEIYNPNGTQLDKWRGFTTTGTVAADTYAKQDYSPIINPLLNNNLPGIYTQFRTFGTTTNVTYNGSNVYTIVHAQINDQVRAVVGQSITLTAATSPPPEYMGTYTVISSSFTGTFPVIGNISLVCTKDSGTPVAPPAWASGLAYVLYDSRVHFRETLPSDTGVGAFGGILDPVLRTQGGLPGNWKVILGSAYVDITENGVGSGFASFNEVDADGTSIRITTIPNKFNSRTNVKDYDPEIVPNDIGGSPARKIGERQLTFSARVKLEARSADYGIHVGFYRTHTASDPQIEFGRGENCVSFYNNGSSTWICKVNARTGSLQTDITNTHSFVTTASVESVQNLAIKVNAEGTQALFYVNNALVYTANGGLPVLGQDYTNTNGLLNQTGIFAGAEIRDVALSGSGSTTAGALRIYDMRYHDFNNFQLTGLKLIKKLK